MRELGPPFCHHHACVSLTCRPVENYYLPFHYTEFWSAFLFTLVEAFTLMSAGVISFDTKWRKVVSKLALNMGVGLTFHVST